MMTLRTGRRRVLWLLAGLPAACTSPNPALYTLAIVPGPVHPTAAMRVELREIALAHYLGRSQIVRSSEDYRLDVLGNEWWGEPLDAMLSRVMVQELSQRLPSGTVFAENGAITATPDATVELNVQRLDEDHTGAVILMAQVGVTGRVTQTRNLRFSVPPPSPGTAGLVAAMSTAVGLLSDAIAADLAQGGAGAVEPASGRSRRRRSSGG
jgi:uncharacterized lipoprotein YmbA